MKARRSRLERATLSSKSGFAAHARVMSIDGKRLSPLIGESELAPGYHYVSVNYEAQYGYVGYRGVRECVIEFEAVAGHDYLTAFEADGGQWSAWLLDATTGERIAECSWAAAPVYSWTPRPRPTPTVGAS